MGFERHTIGAKQENGGKINLVFFPPISGYSPYEGLIQAITKWVKENRNNNSSAEASDKLCQEEKTANAVVQMFLKSVSGAGSETPLSLSPKDFPPYFWTRLRALIPTMLRLCRDYEIDIWVGGQNAKSKLIFPDGPSETALADYYLSELKADRINGTFFGFGFSYGGRIGSKVMEQMQKEIDNGKTLQVNT